MDTYITNLDGTIVQHIEYVPFGEVFIEERNNTWNSPYLFNGKELDEDTGLYYYGARYYNPRESIFLSVDQMVELTMTPYQYAYQNPINYTDPTGMMPEGGPGKEGEPEKEQSLPGIVITGQRSTSKVGVKHSVLSSNYNYSAGNRLQSTIKSNSATASIDRTVNEFVSWIPGAESAELGNALEDYENGDYWGAGLTTFSMIPVLGKLGKLGSKANKGVIKLYRAVSKAELDDIAKNGVRLVPGGYIEKLFATAKKDASNFGYLNFESDKIPFTIIETSIPKKFESLLYKGQMDGMKAISVPKSLLKELATPKVINHTSVPFNNFGRYKWNTYWNNFNQRHGSF